jgi:hypothetical protein
MFCSYKALQEPASDPADVLQPVFGKRLSIRVILACWHRGERQVARLLAGQAFGRSRPDLALTTTPASQGHPYAETLSEYGLKDFGRV